MTMHGEMYVALQLVHPMNPSETIKLPVRFCSEMKARESLQDISDRFPGYRVLAVFISREDHIKGYKVLK